VQIYRWLLFDADGTLFDYERAESTALRQVFESIGIAFDAAYLTIYQRINQMLWQALEQGRVTPKIVKERRFEMLLGEIGVSYSPAEFSHLYLQSLAECSELVEDAAEVVLALKEKYRIAILTNGLQFVQRRRIERSVIRPHIAEMVISEEVGFSKPAREYFKIALGRIGNPPLHEALMIGDGWASDIVGAYQYGLDACWYNPKRQPRPTGCGIVREIVSLQELIGWLG
jgi:putative hydrolase of the HAD superfamily